MRADRDELREVSAVVLALASRRSTRDVLATIVASARRLVDARYAALGVPDDDGGFAEFVADGIPDEQWAAIGPLPRQHGLLGLMLNDPHPVRLDDIRQHPRFGWWPAAHPTLTTFLGMPIVDGEEILGELFLANKDGGFTEQDEELLRLLAGHAAIALVNARLYERSRELSIMEERTRIARELHDSMTQKLFSLRLTAEAAATLADERTAEHLRTITGLAAEAAEELRAIMVGLSPADLAGDGLEPALRKQAELLDRAHGARVTFDAVTGVGNAPGADGDGDGRRLSPAREQAVYRIAQEATHNALRHGPPSHVHIRLSTTDSRLVLEVIDDGPGFDVEEAEDAEGAEDGPAQRGKAQGRARRRLGLTSMRERAQAADGQLRITSTPGRGTTVRVEVPWRGRNA